MKLLLDTHIWIWSVSGSPRLGRAVARAIESQRNELLLSPVSIWEVIILAEKGRLKGIRGGLEWIDRARSALPLQDASLTAEVVREAGNLQFGHKAPADRLIVATARAYDCVLATSDRLIIDSGLAKTLSGG